MLENPGILGEMVKKTGAHNTDLVEPESTDELRAKTIESAKEWNPVAERLWRDPADEDFEKRHDPYQGMDEVEAKKFDRLGRDVKKEKEAALTA